MKIINSILFVLLLFNVNYGFSATTITRHDITWTFAYDETCGTYVNGDPWCVGPVTITAISPASTSIEGRIQHGSETNPPNAGGAGYDNQQNWTYSATNNVARPGGNDLSAGNPLMITVGSLVSTRTKDTPNTRPGIEDASVLTIIASAPAENSFRPPITGTDKTSYWKLSDVNFSLLPRLDKSIVSTAPTEATVSVDTTMDKLWFDVYGGTSGGREFHPSNNMPDYGGSMAVTLGVLSDTVLLDYPQEILEPIVIRLIQYGIDVYGTIKYYSGSNVLSVSTQGALWMGGGGHGHGRKWPMIFAGLMLNDFNILEYADGQKWPIFQEEQQHFYVTQADVDRERYTEDGRPRDPYTVEMIGTPEWGEQHTNQPDRDGSNWDAYYRDIVSPSIAGHILAAEIMGAKTLWNWPSAFEYQERFKKHQIEVGAAIGSYESAFSKEMYMKFHNFNRRIFRIRAVINE